MSSAEQVQFHLVSFADLIVLRGPYGEHLISRGAEPGTLLYASGNAPQLSPQRWRGQLNLFLLFF